MEAGIAVGFVLGSALDPIKLLLAYLCARLVLRKRHDYVLLSLLALATYVYLSDSRWLAVSATSALFIVVLFLVIGFVWSSRAARNVAGILFVVSLAVMIAALRNSATSDQVQDGYRRSSQSASEKDVRRLAVAQPQPGSSETGLPAKPFDAANGRSMYLSAEGTTATRVGSTSYLDLVEQSPVPPGVPPQKDADGFTIIDGQENPIETWMLGAKRPTPSLDEYKRNEEKRVNRNPWLNGVFAPVGFAYGVAQGVSTGFMHGGNSGAALFLAAKDASDHYELDPSWRSNADGAGNWYAWAQKNAKDMPADMWYHLGSARNQEHAQAILNRLRSERRALAALYD